MSKKLRSLGAGLWTYRSYYNNPLLSATNDELALGQGNLRIEISDEGYISGEIGGPGWGLELNGYMVEGNPVTLQFQGTGTVDGHPWVYAYIGYVVPHIPAGKSQVPAIVGAVTRVIEHPGSDGTPHRAGEVGSFYAVAQ